MNPIVSSSMKKRTKCNEIPDKEVDLTELKNKVSNFLNR